MADAATPLDEMLNNDPLAQEEEVCSYGEALDPRARNRKNVEQHPRFATYTQVQNIGTDLIDELANFFAGNAKDPDRSSEKDYQFDQAINGGLLEALLIWIGNTETERIDAKCDVTVDPPTPPIPDMGSLDPDEEETDGGPSDGPASP